MPKLVTMLSHLPFLHFVSDRNLRLLYTVRVIKDLLNRITLFFLPIFIFVMGYDGLLLGTTYLTALQRGMVLLALYFIINRIVVLVTAVPIGKIIYKVGFSRAMIYSYLLRLISFAALMYSQQFPWLLLVATVFEALQSNFFWNTFFTILTNQSVKTEIGSNLGGLQLMLQLVTAISPALAGFVALQFGFGALFLIGIGLLLISMIFIMQMDIHMIHDQVSWTGFWQWFDQKSLGNHHLSIIGRYINDVALFIWPLYVFLLLGSIDKVGFLYTISLFIAMILTFFISMYLDKTKNRKPFFFSGGVMSMIWIARTQVFTIWGIALVDIMERLTANYHWLFYDMVFIRGGRGEHAFSYFVYREMVMSIGAIIFWGSLVAFFAVTTSWNAIFIFGGISVLLSLLLMTGKHGKQLLAAR
ncbi:MAG: MFS transporter [Patescibacteria group bacterium]